MNSTKPALLDPVTPLCPVFGTCGGCSYQNIPYEQELSLKQEQLQSLFAQKLELDESVFDPIVASPEPYHYRNRLDLNLRRRKGEITIGFQIPGTHRQVAVESCAIARKEISDFMPELQAQASAKLPDDYRAANLVVRTGDDGRVLWGGIGRRSLRMAEEDYFFTVLRGRKIFYSLETFFQANLYILPAVMDVLEKYAGMDGETHFLDLYSGTGLFGLCFADQVKKVYMIEEVGASTTAANYAVRYHDLKNVEIRTGRVEDQLPLLLNEGIAGKKVAIVDPPRKGLTPSALETLCSAKDLDSLFYLSCFPEALARDLTVFIEKGWKVEKIIPFDFFPRTNHLETLALLKPVRA